VSNSNYRSASAAAAAALLATAFLAAPASATQAIKSNVSTDIDHADFWVTPQPVRNLFADSIFNRAPPNGGQGSASSHSTISAQFDSPDSGTVIALGSLRMRETDPIDPDYNIGYSSGFEYQFVADADGLLSFDLRAGFSGVAADVGRWHIFATDLVDRSNLVNVVVDGYDDGAQSLERTGSLRLFAGHRYDFFLTNGGFTLGHDLPGLAEAREGGAMTWSITAGGAGVPEPAAWGLMLSGFAVVGGALRARRAIHA
jgi:hypothetical protein